MKRISKYILVVMLVAAMLMGAAQAAVKTTGNVNLRKGPGLDYEIVGDVKPDQELEFKGQVSTDERGVDWYLVEHKGSECWISSRYSELVGEEMPVTVAYDPAEAANWTEVSGYYQLDQKESAQALGLTNYEEAGGEAPYRYSNDVLEFAGFGSVTDIRLEGAGYTVFGVACGMTIEEAKEKLTEAGLILYSEEYDRLVFEHPSNELSWVDVNGVDSCIEVYCPDGVAVSVNWSTYTG